ncbi:hypothetical protein C1645_831915 [Glomus cerebriforme]|uniref:Uncharacterized protein n=1 Tax=Glomus cerebriforme TaxID=658196 RepID=A0A397SEJ2_9GLOM|nr:hypothetical protein C1645_831915 [Glomus cerebriforme]
MDLDSRTYSKLRSVRGTDVKFREYQKILEALQALYDRYDHETPEMWCSRIRDPFRKILKENLGVLSGNGYIIMCRKLIERTNSLSSGDSYRDNHFKGCINGDIISNEHARIKDIFQSIDEKEFTIWKYKQFILREEAEMKRLQLELFSQSTSHSEKDKLASVSYDGGSGLADYETYLLAKATVAKNTMPSAPNFEPACISPARQEVVLPTPYQSLDPKGTTSKIFISSQYAKQNNLLASTKGTVLRLRDGTKRAYRSYKKRPESLAKRIWEVVRNDGTPNEKKFLDINNESSVQPGYICYGYEGRCYLQGYTLVRGVNWIDVLKWSRNPEYYRINKKYNFEYFIKISDCKKYSGKLTGVQHICDSQLLKKYDILGKKLTINFSDLDDNCEFVR